MAKTAETGDRKTRRAILNLLKTEGPLTSQTLAEKLNLTAMAVRQHLYALEGEKFVSVEERPVPIGRPAKHWQLTPAADRFFPDAYAELSVSLISALGDALGPDGLQRVLETRCARQQDTYRAAVPAKAPVEEKLPATRARPHRGRLHGGGEAGGQGQLPLRRKSLPDLRGRDAVPGTLFVGTGRIPQRAGARGGHPA